jgi:hypothetical protein
MLNDGMIKRMDKMNYIDKESLAAYLGISTRTIDHWLQTARENQMRYEEGEKLTKQDQRYIDFLLKYNEVKNRPFDLFDKHVLTAATFVDDPNFALKVMKAFYPDRFGEKSNIEITQGDPFSHMTDEEIAEKLAEYEIE